MSGARPTRLARAATPARVVLDPQLVLRALLHSDEQARQLRRAWQQGLMRPLLNAEGAAQLMRALAYPALGLTAGECEELLADFLPYVDVVKLEGGMRMAAAGLTPSQVQLLQLGRSGDARWIITGSAALLAWAARASKRQPGARDHGAIIDVTSWYRVLTPSQKTQLLC